MSALKLRASALPLAFRCAGALQPAEVDVDPYNEAAEEGTAGHEVMRRIVDMDLNSIDDVDVTSIARQFEVDDGDLRIHAFVGVRVWKELRAMFPTPHAEVRLRLELPGPPGIDQVFLTGQLDVFSIDRARRVANVADWKFGRLDGDHRHQLAAYSALVLMNYPEVDRVDAFAVWMRDGEVEPYSMDRVQMEAWLDNLLDTVAEWDGTYRPGRHCIGCRRAHECPARVAMVRQDVEMIAGPELAAELAVGLSGASPAAVVSLRRKAKAIAGVLKQLDEAIAIRVNQAGGVLDDGAGRELRFRETEHRAIDPLLAAPVLEKFLSDAEIAQCMKMSAGKFDDAVARKTDRGLKKKRIAEFGEALRAAGAVTIEKRRRLEDRKKR